MRVRSFCALLLGLSLGVFTVQGCAGSATEYTPPPATDDAGTDGGTTTGDMSTTNADMLPAMCQLVPASGCLPGNKCTTHDAVTTTCDPDGTVNRGQRCATQNMIDNCFATNVCANSGGGIGMCRAFCRTNGDCGNRSYCDLGLGTAGMRVCTQACNALGATAGCPSGLACYAYNFEHVDCRIPGTVAEAMPCTRAEDCQPGMTCLGAVGAERCRVLCTSFLDCSGVQDCYEILYQGTQPWPTYGYCN